MLSVGRSDPLSRVAMDLTLSYHESQLCVLLLLRSVVSSVEYFGDPMAQIFLPIFDSFNRTTRKPVALITALVHWRAYFRDILPANIKGVDVVLENTCDGFFTFQVSQ